MADSLWHDGICRRNAMAATRDNDAILTARWLPAVGASTSRVRRGVTITLHTVTVPRVPGEA